MGVLELKERHQLQMHQVQCIALPCALDWEFNTSLEGLGIFSLTFEDRDETSDRDDAISESFPDDPSSDSESSGGLRDEVSRRSGDGLWRLLSSLRWVCC